MTEGTVTAREGAGGGRAASAASAERDRRAAWVWGGQTARVPRPNRSGPSALVIPLLLGLLGVLSLGLLAWGYRINEMQGRGFARMDAVMDLRISASVFHLWLEEHLHGQPGESPEHLWGDLARADALTDALLEGGSTEHGHQVEPLDEPELRGQGEGIRAGLRTLRTIATERLELGSRGGVGSALDGEFNAVFHRLHSLADELETEIEKRAAANQIWWRRIMGTVFVAWTVVIAVATTGLFLDQRRRLVAERGLREVRRELEETNRELERRVAERTASLTAANEALTREVEQRRLVQESLLDHQERLRELSSQISLAEERERRRIAVEVHDRIGTGLALASMKLATSLDEDPSSGAAEHTRIALALVNEAIEHTRSIAFALSTPILYELGLGAALEWLAEKVQGESGLPIVFEDGGICEALDKEQEILLYWSVRELLVNVVKHARASGVWVSCQREDGDVRVVVEDDGIGISEAAAADRADGRKGLGLFSIRQRMSSMGGYVEAEPRPGGGTQVTLVVPGPERETCHGTGGPTGGSA